jgi:integrase
MRTVRQNPLNIYESKSRRTRTITINKELHAELLRRYTCDSDAYAFHSVRDFNKPYDRTTFHRKLKKALTGLNFDASAHSSRKLYAQNIFKICNDVETVQQALHHQKITTTLTYLDK